MGGSFLPTLYKRHPYGQTRKEWETLLRRMSLRRADHHHPQHHLHPETQRAFPGTIKDKAPSYLKSCAE